MSAELTPNDCMAELYDRLAPTYDEMVHDQPWNDLVEEITIRTLCERRPGPIRRLLDLGAGTGLSTRVSRVFAPEAEITALDKSGGMLARLEESMDVTNLYTVQGSIEDYVRNFNGSFDVITAMSCLEFVPQLPYYLKRIAAHLGQNAVMGMTFKPVSRQGPDMLFSYSHTGLPVAQFLYPVRDIEASLEEKGLKIMCSDPIESAYKIGSGPGVCYHFIAAARL